MARRNLVRSLLAVSLSLVPFAAGLVAASAPAGSAEAKPDPQVHTIRLSEKSGFTPGALDDQYSVRVGDFIKFVLDMKTSSSRNHSVTFDDTSTCPPGGPCWPELRFNDTSQSCTWRRLPLPDTRCFEVRTAGPVRYYDRLHQEATGVDFQGFIKVAGMATTTTTEPVTTTTLAPTTTTTAAPTTATTTTTTTTRTTSTTRTTTTTGQPPTTATTDPATIRPFLIASPTSTITTASPVTGAPTSTTGGKGKDKGKGKGASASTSTTAAPEREALPVDVSFADSLALGPVTLPDSLEAAGTADGAELDAAMGLLVNAEQEPGDDQGGFLIAVVAAAGILLLTGALIAWGRRSSRYFPA